jgi:hypothetical protein
MVETREAALWLAAALGLCCVSVPALLGGAAVGGAAGATAVSTGVASLRSLAATVAVTAATLVPVYLVWRWRAG